MLPTRFTFSTSLSPIQVLDKMSASDGTCEGSGSSKDSILSRFRAVMYSSDRPLEVTVDRAKQSFVLRDIVRDNQLRVVCQGRVVEQDGKTLIRAWARYTILGLCMSVIVLGLTLLLAWKIVPIVLARATLSADSMLVLFPIFLLGGFLLFNSWLIRKLVRDQLKRLLRKS
jgi:hypothetical protein